MFPVEEDKNHDVVLELNSPKSGIFATDQTPTPTGLFKNCEEYGIFEDLKHVNPFEEIFRHAVEEKTAKATTTTDPQVPLLDEESLHTPQVFPQIEPTTNTTKILAIKRTQSANSDLTTPTPNANELDLIEIKTSNINKTTEQPAIKRYRLIAEKPPSPASASSTSSSITGTAIPIQTVKPLFKVNTSLKTITNRAPNCTVTSPSSASLTPTSQLPIKERLKVILNNNKSQRSIAAVNDVAVVASNSGISKKSAIKYDERCMERRRAAATRYRAKMRNEQKDLRKRNAELQAENEKLTARVRELEQQLAQKQTISSSSNDAAIVPLQIPSSSIHLIMNIPKLIVPANGPPLLQNPITYSVEKK